MIKITTAILALALLAIGSAKAQNVIIENEYVRAGVNLSTGTLGSGGSTRPGLQFDNTGTHTWPCSSCQGDYLTPGSPFEGFTVRIENSSSALIRSYINNNTGTRSITTGAWVGTPSASSAIWSATTSDFTIQHSYSLPGGQKYIDINTQITAITAMPKLYFGRYIDPDAMPMTGDTSATDNVRGYGAIPKTNVAFSEATTSRYALGLYSAATNVNAGMSRSWSTDPKTYYTGGDYDVERGDHTIGLGFYMANVAIGDIVNFRYAYIFGPNAFSAASSAITGGAGGGTAGSVPGGGTLTDVGSATSAASTSSAPTVVSTSTATITVSDTNSIDSSLPVVTASLAHHTASEASGKQTIARETTTNVTTPMVRDVVTKVRTTTTWSDSTTTTSDSAPTTTSTLWNDVATSVANDSFSGRIDQHERLASLNLGLNRGLNMNPFRKDGSKSDYGTTYINLNTGKSTMGDGYSASSTVGGVAFDREIKPNWKVGIQYNKIDTTLNGVDSKTTQAKNQAGLYSIYNLNGFIIANNLGYANNSVNSERNVENMFSNNHTTSGKDVWLNNRVYTPEVIGVRPFVGYTMGRVKTNGYTENGSIQSARTVAGAIDNYGYAEAGVQLDKRVNNVVMTGQLSSSTDRFTNADVMVGYNLDKNSLVALTASRQVNKDLATNMIGVRAVIGF